MSTKKSDFKCAVIGAPLVCQQAVTSVLSQQSWLSCAVQRIVGLNSEKCKLGCILQNATSCSRASCHLTNYVLVGTKSFPGALNGAAAWARLSALPWLVPPCFLVISRFSPDFLQLCLLVLASWPFILFQPLCLAFFLVPLPSQPFGFNDFCDSNRDCLTVISFSVKWIST